MTWYVFTSPNDQIWEVQSTAHAFSVCVLQLVDRAKATEVLVDKDGAGLFPPGTAHLFLKKDAANDFNRAQFIGLDTFKLFFRKPIFVIYFLISLFDSLVSLRWLADLSGLFCPTF